MSIGKEDDARPGPLKRAIICKYCKAGTTHILGTYANDSYADYENAKCGNCRDEEIFQMKLKRGLATQQIKRRMNELKRKADIQGMVDSFKKNERKDFGSLFKSPGIYSNGKVKREYD